MTNRVRQPNLEYAFCTIFSHMVFFYDLTWDAYPLFVSASGLSMRPKRLTERDRQGVK